MGKKTVLMLFLGAAVITPKKIHPVATLQVTNIPSRQGKVMVGVYKSQSDFKNRKTYKGFAVDINGSSVTVELKDLEPGWYMIAVYHDTNENHELDSRLFGPPVEAYGFSNNAKGFFGPASFDDAKFFYDGRNLFLNIKLGGI